MHTFVLLCGPSREISQDRAKEREMRVKSFHFKSYTFL